LVGSKPPADWTSEKLSQELFVAFDRVRFAELYGILDQGLAAYRAGQLEAMASAFDQVLARAPAFERRAEMVPGWLAYAKSLEESYRARAMEVLRKALRVASDGPSAPAVASQLLYLETLGLAEHGVIDEGGYRRALELDPNNADARVALQEVVDARRARSRVAMLYGTVGAGAAVLLVAAMVFLLRRRAAAAP
jgi:hypothetical protein